MSELWLKDNKVLTLKDVDGVPGDILKIDTPELLPLSLKKSCTWEKFNEWLLQRSIPKDREDLDITESMFGKDWEKNKNYLSLSDQYWIKKRDESWKKINYFTNLYSTDIGDMVFMPWKCLKKKKFNNNSPDLTTNGILKKRWIQDLTSKESYLVKAASKKTKQEPLSEVLVSVLVEQIGVIPSAGYDLHIEGTTMCSKCKNFITENTELVLAKDFYFYEERKEGESVFDHLLKLCEKFDIPDVEKYLEWMVFIDIITGNKDRNLSNIGFIRDISTLKFIGPAPLFDCGNAYNDTKLVNNNVRSQQFGDVEQEIYKKLQKECDFDKVAKDFGYKKIINDYPNITEKKKENLIEAISKKNKSIINTQKLENVER